MRPETENEAANRDNQGPDRRAVLAGIGVAAAAAAASAVADRGRRAAGGRHRDLLEPAL